MIRFWLAHNDPCDEHESERRDVYILAKGTLPRKEIHECGCTLFFTGLLRCVELGRWSTKEWEENPQFPRVVPGYCSEVTVTMGEAQNG